MLVISPQVAIPDDELEFQYARSGGPGGQNVNKVSSKALLRFAVLTSPSLPAEVRERFRVRYGSRLTTSGEVLIASQRFRDQKRNADDCREKLAEMLQAVLRPPRARRKTRPTAASRERRLEQKKRRSGVKRGRRTELD